MGFFDEVFVQPMELKSQIKKYAQASEQGDVDAMVELGKIYEEEGILKKKYAVKAAQYYQMAADKGSPEAMLRLSELYNRGKGVETDKKKCFEYVQKAAELDYAPALRYLGSYYFGYKTLGIEPDIEKAKSILQKAIDLGDTRSYLVLAARYLDGEVLERNDKLAVKLMEKAASLGDVRALLDLGEYYLEGTEEESEERVLLAFDYYMKAAKQGDCIGQYHVGKMYERGIGVERDRDKAIMWYEKSAKEFLGARERLQKLGVRK